MTLVNFASSRVGRGARVAVGPVMVGIGLALGGGWLTWPLAGLVPLAAGASGLCLIAPFLHQPLRTTGSRGA